MKFDINKKEFKKEIINRIQKGYLRKGGPGADEQLKALGFNQEAINELKNPVFGNRSGYQTFELSNNLAEIKRLQTRVATLEAKQTLAQTHGTKTEEIGGIHLVHNYEADRIQLHFDGKPAPDTIKELKSRGFRWTPSQMT